MDRHYQPTRRAAMPHCAETALDARERYTIELGRLGASPQPRCCKHQSGSHAAGGSAAGIGHEEPRARRS
jgi:hypothetical protein